MDGNLDDDCPVCKGPFQNPSEPAPCCRKVFCHSCLKQAISVRPQCPYCRSPVNDPAAHALGSVIRHAIRLPGTGTSLQTARTVGPNVQALLNQLRAASAQSSQTASTANVSLPSQAASTAALQVPAYSAIRPPIRPIPRPRRQFTSPVAPTAPVSSMPNPICLQANPSFRSIFQLDDPDDVNWQVQFAAMENAFHPGNLLRTYNCPYCQEGGLDDLELRDHCNENHLYDQRRVVCPVCVSLPHGNPTYCSRDFIGHLNLRHSYYVDDITNVYQSDDMNLQDTILRSLQEK